jgi:pSer/pThr/pTyr-binding forkhead associated (FHA) protein
MEEQSMSDSNPGFNLKLIEGRAFILGRQGHILIDSIMASNQHAELRVVKQKIYLRDLDSTNGTFLIKDGAPVRIKKGYVELDDTVFIGGVAHTVEQLLTIANEFAETGNGGTTEIQIADDM